MKNSKSVEVVTLSASLDTAIAVHKKAIDDIKKFMKPAGKEATLVLVPKGYDLRFASTRPKQKDQIKEICVMVRIASVSGVIFYELNDGRIVRAKYCDPVGVNTEKEK